ncbi:MAG TPA: hypothetical protein VJB63_01475 [Patescibacteria group bacterium]|nr:hypothetical protein [Patescibacteria group bacterium]
MNVTNKELVQLLRSVVVAYILKGENRFKIIAYERTIHTIEHMSSELYNLWKKDALYTTHGIGQSILSHIEDYFKKGEASYCAKVISSVPQSVFALMSIAGIGPKKAYALTKALQLEDSQSAVDELQRACEQNKVAGLESFGEKSQSDMYKAIIRYKKNVKKNPRMLLSSVIQKAEDVRDYLNKHQLVKRVDVLGSLRRKVSSIGDIDILVQVKSQKSKVKNSSQTIIDYFIQYPQVVSVIGAGEKKASVIISSGEQIDLRIADMKTFGTMLQYFTGSKEHNIKLREHALGLGYSLSEYGIKEIKSPKSKVKNRKKLKTFRFRNEEDLYTFLGLEYIPPELREGTNEIELAGKKMLPKLVTLYDIRGDFHIHSSYDLEPSHDLGENTYEEILKKASTLQYEYVAFADHNPSISRHSELEVVAILKRRKEYIVQKNMSNKIERVHFFISLEVDIRPDGSIAFPDAALDYVDMLIVSIHSRFDMPYDDMTTRILNAITYPKVKILAHPTTRLLEKREEIDADWDIIFDNCQKKNIAIEINASPHRLDLPDLLVRRAVEKGVKLVINTDAHATDQMNGMKWGVSVARRGFAKKNDIINTFQYNDVKKWIEEVKN